MNTDKNINKRTSELSRLRIGKVSEGWLNEIGIYTEEELRAIGPVVAYVKVCLQQPRASLNLLYGLWAALEGIRWQDVPAEIKEQLRREVQEITFS